MKVTWFLRPHCSQTMLAPEGVDPTAAAAWLFGSDLAGLTETARRKA